MEKQEVEQPQRVPQPQAQPQVQQQPVEQKPKREVLKADNVVFDDTDITNFEYLAKKVAVLQEQVELMQRILEQNNLTYKVEARANVHIEDKTWELLGSDE